MRFFQHNLALKLICLALASSLYFWVRLEEQHARREFTAPLEIPIPSGQVLVEPPAPPLVRVTISGPSNQLDALRSEQIRPIVHLEGYQPGQGQRLRVDLPGIGEPLRVTTLPAWVQIRTEARIEKRVQISIDAEGALPEGWDWSVPPRTESSEVTVSGLQSVVDRVVRVVAALQVLNPQEQLRLSVPLRAFDRADRQVHEQLSLDPSQVLVQARLQRTVWSKRVHVQPIFTPPPGVRLRVTVDPQRVMVYGTARALQEFHFIETPEIDVQLAQPRFSREVRLEPAPGIVRIEPPTARVTIEQLGVGEGR